MTEISTATHEPATRFAAIDVGTNSIRLIVAESLPDGGYRLLDDEKEPSGLGMDMANSSELSPGIMRQAQQTIAHMKAIAEGYGVPNPRAVATCAVREANNRQQFVDLVYDATGLKLEVISGEEEAKLAYLSVSYAMDIRSRSVATVDIGGGSTEIVLSNNGVIEYVHSLPLGAVRLTEAHNLDQLPDENCMSELRKTIKKTLKKHVSQPVWMPQFMIGTGGTFTSLAAIALGRESTSRRGDLDHAFVRGYELERSQVKRILHWLSSMSTRERTNIQGLSEDRARIIVAGIAIIQAVMKRLGIRILQVHDRGIRDGLLLSMINDQDVQHDSFDHGPNRMKEIENYAQRCQYDRQHCEHVARLTGRIFDQLQQKLPSHESEWMTPHHRELLLAAAILHDVGYHVNYRRHHKHSYHLITHSEMPGFNQRELEIIALVARYHRRALPKQRHEAFSRLSVDDQLLVQRLAAILRMSDGLDRSHTASVSDVTLDLSSKCALFNVHSSTDPGVNLWGAARKSQLFQTVFDLEARFESCDS